MSDPKLNRTLAELVTERADRATALDRFELDYGAGGEISLADACAAAGLQPEAVIAALAELEAQPSGEPDYSAWSMSELADHIEATHHALVRRTLPRLAELLGAAEADWRDEFAALFAGLRAELEMHMFKEEQILFPICRQLEQGATEFHCGSVRNPIAVMEHEHDSAAGAMAAMRRMTSGFNTDGLTPPTAELVTLAAELERDLRRHIHKENHLLFPRAAETEQAALPV